jgi:hypothetical protein
METLSVEMLLEVFAFLPGESLKEAVLVCKEWNEIIGSSAPTMKKLRLRLRMPVMDTCPCHILEKKTGRMNPKTEAEVLNFRRKYKSVYADLMQIDPRENPSYLRILQNFGENLINLYLKDPYLINFSDLFSSMLNIEEMELIRCHNPENIKMDSICTIELKKLKKLTMFGCDDKILKCFNGPNVTSIHFTSVDLSSDFAKRFFCGLTKLKKLKLCGYEKENFFEENIQELPFKLKKLILSFSSKDEMFDDKLKEFLKLQKNSLIKLIWSNVSPTIFKSILSDMKKLKKISICVDSLPKETEFYEFLKPNHNLEEIILYDYYKKHSSINDEKCIDMTIKSCPNLIFFKNECCFHFRLYQLW